MTHQHAKVITTDTFEDGSTKTVAESYYEKLSHRTEEVEKYLLTSRQNILKDIIECIDPILKGSPRITLTIEAKNNEPFKITKRIVTLKESFDRK